MTWSTLVMDKEHILEHLRAARSAHIKWVQKAKLLVSGLDVEEDAIPVDSTECKFGKWFYGEGQVLNALSNNPIEYMNTIENLHSNLHDKYLQIFHIYFNQGQKGFFEKLFGSRKKNISEQDIELSQKYYDELEQISRDLLDEIHRLERRLIAVPEDMIAKLV